MRVLVVAALLVLATSGASSDANREKGHELRSMGMQLYRQDRVKEAHELYLQALELEPELAENHALVATACQKLAVFGCAVNAYGGAIDLESDPVKSISYREALANVHRQTKQFRAAIDVYQAALALPMIDPSTKNRLRNEAHSLIDEWQQATMEKNKAQSDLFARGIGEGFARAYPDHSFKIIATSVDVEGNVQAAAVDPKATKCCPGLGAPECYTPLFEVAAKQLLNDTTQWEADSAGISGEKLLFDELVPATKDAESDSCGDGLNIPPSIGQLSVYSDYGKRITPHLVTNQPSSHQA